MSFLYFIKNLKLISYSVFYVDFCLFWILRVWADTAHFYHAQSDHVPSFPPNRPMLSITFRDNLQYWMVLPSSYASPSIAFQFHVFLQALWFFENSVFSIVFQRIVLDFWHLHLFDLAYGIFECMVRYWLISGRTIDCWLRFLVCSPYYFLLFRHYELWPLIVFFMKRVLILRALDIFRFIRLRICSNPSILTDDTQLLHYLFFLSSNNFLSVFLLQRIDYSIWPHS